MEKTTPNFYAIIPANVRYDKELKANSKLMYGEVTALSNKEGYCWASNKYFAELYEVTPQAISNWIKLLEKKGYIKIEYIREGKEIKQRNIYVEVSINIDRVSIKKEEVYQQKFKENTTSFNTTINKDIVEYLNLKTNSNYKHATEATVKIINARLKEGYTLEDFKTVIDKKTKQWLNDEKMSNFLRPLTLFGTKFESYLNEKDVKTEKVKEKKIFTKQIGDYRIQSL